MKCGGQVHLEALICFAVFMAIVGSFLAAMGNIETDAKTGADAFTAESSAQKCAIVIDSLYANGGGELDNLEINCFLKKKNWVGSTSGENEKIAFAFPNEIEFFHLGGKTTMWVKVNAHYR